MTTTLKSAPLLDDQPSDEDRLNFAPFVGAFEGIILDKATKTPFIAGIFGRWGTGKTTLMRMLRKRLDGRGATTIWFSAWSYNDEERVWAAFLQSLTSQLADKLTTKAKIQFAGRVYRRGLDFDRLIYSAAPFVVKALVVIAPALAAAAIERVASPAQAWLAHTLGIAFSSAAAVWVFVRPALKAARDELKPDFKLYRSVDFEEHVGFLDRFREQFGRIVQSLPNQASRVVVFVDDLDRCAPEKALQLLDAIKVFLDAPNCVFVLGVDVQIMKEAIKAKYPNDATAQKEYLSKIVQLPFQLPPLSDSDLREYLKRLDVAFPDERCRGVMLESLSRNPRELKRVINTFTLHWHLAHVRSLDGNGRVKPVRLAKVIVIQQAYAELYALLRDQPELLALLERQFRLRKGEAAPGSERDLYSTQEVAISGNAEGQVGIALPPSLTPFANETPLVRLLTMHPLGAAEADDASFAVLDATQIQAYFTLTPGVDVRTAAAPGASGVSVASGAAEGTSRGSATLRSSDGLPSFGDRFSVVRKIGAGGAGDVYLARDARSGLSVVIKRLSPTLSRDPSWNARFEREARLISGLEHPNLVRGLESGRADDGTSYVVTEYVDGEALDRRLQRGPMDADDIRRQLGPIFGALAYLHDRHIIHRDIKPSNILLSTTGAKLSDYSLALNEPTGLDSLTRIGVAIGTPAYMSPEQVVGDAVDHRSDLYSFGLVLFEALTGKLPFAGKTAQEIMIARVQSDPTPPRTFSPGAPRGADKFFATILARDPAKRFASATAAQKEFDAVFGPIA